RTPHAAKIGNHDRMVAGEIDRHGRPHVARLTVAVKQDHGGAAAAGAHMDRRTVRRDVLNAEFRRKLERLHVCLLCPTTTRAAARQRRPYPNLALSLSEAPDRCSRATWQTFFARAVRAI